MRPEEEYVLETLTDCFGGRFIEGENPPDGYIINRNTRVAVEVSMLVENLYDENGKQYSRLKDDAPAEILSKKIEDNISANIPEGLHVFLVIGAPVKKIRKTQTFLAAKIIEMIQDNIPSWDQSILGNRISISIFKGWRKESRKIGSAISNRYSSAKIGENVENILRDRIRIKNGKRNIKSGTDEYWLALYNHYWLADERSYKLAYKNIKIEHNFDKIFIVNENRKAYELAET